MLCYDIRLHLTKKQRIATIGFFNTSFLEPQNPDFSQKKATKVKDRESPRSQSSKKIWLGKFFLFDFSPNWTILSILSHTCFFGLFWPCGLYGLQRPKRLAFSRTTKQASSYEQMIKKNHSTLLLNT